MNKEEYKKRIIKGNYTCEACKNEHWGAVYIHNNGKRICPACYDKK